MLDFSIFGGTGDGVTLNDAAMTAALTYLKGISGDGELLIPSGRYRFSSTINVYRKKPRPNHYPKNIQKSAIAVAIDLALITRQRFLQRWGVM